MFDTLYNNLLKMMHPDRARMIRSGYESLLEIGFTDYEYELATMNNALDAVGIEQYVSGVIAILNAGLNVVISEFDNVFFFEDTDLPEKVDLISAYIKLSDFGSPDIILAHTESGDGTFTEVLANVLAEVTERDSEWWESRIISVSPAFIHVLSERMNLLLEQEEALNTERPTQVDLRIEALRAMCRTRAKQFRERVRPEALFLMEHIAQGCRSGRPISEYISLIRDDMIEIPDSKAMLAAENILFCVYYSRTNDTEVLQTAQLVSENIYGLGRFQSEVHGAITEAYQKGARSNG